MTSRRCVAVVAHPDDETLFAAGYMLRFPGDWHVICCTIPRADPVRAEKFYAACAALGAIGEVLPQTEPGHGEPLPWVDALDLSGFDVVLTHNPVGEYGHAHHRYVSAAVRRRAPARRLVLFGHDWSGTPLRLTGEEVLAKTAALACYDHVQRYAGDLMTKGQALARRYYDSGRYRLDEDFYVIP